MARTGIVWPFFWTSLALLASGCKGVDLSSVPLADELGFVEVKPVPKEIRTRYGPTSKDRLEDIRKQRNRAKHGSDKVKEEISGNLAQQIRREPNAFLRQEIVRTLAECQTSVAADILRQGLNDESVDVQIQCCRGWGKWGGEESVDVLGQVLQNKLATMDLKIAAIDALQTIGNLESAPFLVPLLDKREDPALQYRSLKALQKITGKSLADDQEAWETYIAEERDAAAVLEAKSSERSATPSLFWWR
ncbi:MAG: hypothetical protein CMJ74_05185 [Planctomycetaceae bacterium]|nr:hypothetical protein [Planctomycetaceae bacterium]|tara:strand:- start:3674 stop:4417 length:744 start_codon:yes stop_codon:yes gene_type:complete